MTANLYEKYVVNVKLEHLQERTGDLIYTNFDLKNINGLSSEQAFIIELKYLTVSRQGSTRTLLTNVFETDYFTNSNHV